MNLNRLVGRTVPYILLALAALLVLYSYLARSSFNLNFLMTAVGVVAGLYAAYIIYHSLEQEKNIQLFEGEDVILKSSGSKTFAFITVIADKDIPPNPINATVYLTNMGILCEPKGTGEVALFIPLDRIREFAPDKGGIRIRYIDLRMTYAEAMIYVEDRNVWMQTLAGVFNTAV